MKKFSNYLFDIGSTRVKWLFNGSITTILVKDFDPEKFQTERIYYSNVNPILKDKLSKLSNWINIKELFKTDTEYKWLGTDRQVAIYRIKNSIVVDFGTAITIDIIKDSFHKGGYILLGLKKYFDEVEQTFPHINFSKNSESCECDKFLPNLSACAIFCGYITTIANFLENLKKEYSLEIIATGGDSEIFQKLNKNLNIKLDKELIFNNMIKILEDKNKNDEFI
jgi:type III pantothenate kinase